MKRIHQVWQQLKLKEKRVCYYLVFSLLLLSNISIGQSGLMVEYFDGKDFNKFVSAAFVEDINLSWNSHPPAEGIDPHDCAIRWTGKLISGKSAKYIFGARVDDGIRVWIDNELIIDQWNLNDVGLFNGSVFMEANKPYNLRVEYFNALREGEIKLLWDIQKPKEELSWYEKLFGVERNFRLITSDYYLRPDTPLPSTNLVSDPPEEEIVVEKVTPPPVKKVVKKKPIDPVDIPAEKPPVKEVMTVAIAKKYIPKNVQFEHAKAVILKSSFTELDIFARFMSEHPEVRVSIEGHTEPIGDTIKNQELSEKRAFKVARYLVEKGISGKRIKTKGYGGSRPLKIPKKGEYHPENRRVVFTLSGLDL